MKKLSAAKTNHIGGGFAPIAVMLGGAALYHMFQQPAAQYSPFDVQIAYNQYNQPYYQAPYQNAYGQVMMQPVGYAQPQYYYYR